MNPLTTTEGTEYTEKEPARSMAETASSVAGSPAFLSVPSVISVVKSLELNFAKP